MATQTVLLLQTMMEKKANGTRIETGIRHVAIAVRSGTMREMERAIAIVLRVEKIEFLETWKKMITV